VREASVLFGLTGLFLFAPNAARGQGPAKPEFEVASVRPHVSGSGVHIHSCSGDRFSSVGVMFGNVLQWAYEFPGVTGREFQEGVRATSINRGFYDIQAKADHPVTESECHLMVRALIEDRFKLAYHWELRDAEVSDLVVARGGPKIRKALDTDKGTDVDVIADGKPLRWALPADSQGMAPKGMTMQELAERLIIFAAPEGLEQISDKTGLEGRYKIDLRFSISLIVDAPDFGDPGLDAALAQQLGLRLEKHKGSIKVPVLDHIEAPDPRDN
jgi:uncharacterized protein (TIGR03435 family)